MRRMSFVSVLAVLSQSGRTAALEVVSLNHAVESNWLLIVFILTTFSLILLIAILGYRLRRAGSDQDRFGLLWSHIPNCISEIDTQGNILKINHTLVDTLTPRDVIGRNVLDFLKEKERNQFRQSLNAAVKLGEVRDYEVEFQLPDRVAYLQNRIVPIGEVNPGIRTCLIITTDMTRHREAEQTLEKAREQANRNASAKSVFLANMSHELRTPLSGIVGMVSLIEETYASDEMRHYTQPLLSSVEHLRRIVDDILDLSKVDSGKILLDVTDTNLWQILDDLEGLYESQAMQKGIELRINTTREVPRYIRVDAFRLRQILYNLLGNAMKFTTEGSVKLDVGVQTLVEKPMLKFSVRDTGVGLSEEQQESIFDAFKETDTQVNRKLGGTGLGLAICKKLTELMGGVIGVNSQQGSGSEFWFSVPMVESNEIESWDFWREKGVSLELKNRHQQQWFYRFFNSLAIPVVENGALLVTDHLDQGNFPWLWWLGAEYDLHGTNAISLKPPLRRGALCNRLLDYQLKQTHAVQEEEAEQESSNLILLVEDNPTNQLVVRRMLEKMGFEVDVANNGEEGVNKWNSKHYAAIIMDIQMPVMDGIEATHLIRQKETTYTPIIALTANAQDEVEESCFAAGMDAFLTKPVDRPQLQSTVEAVLGGHRMTTTGLES